MLAFLKVAKWFINKWVSDGKFVLPSLAFKSGTKNFKFELEISFDKRFFMKHETNVKITETFLNIFSYNIFKT